MPPDDHKKTCDGLRQRLFESGRTVILGLSGVLSDRNVWCLAGLLINKHGGDAEVEAARQQDLMLERGNCDGRILWTRIRLAIEVLQAAPSGRPN